MWVTLTSCYRNVPAEGEFLIPITIVATGLENLIARDRAKGSGTRRYRPVLAGVFGFGVAKHMSPYGDSDPATQSVHATDRFQAEYIRQAIAVKDGKLMIDKTPNGESPLVKGAAPILGVDVWEHSYYIDYRNARPKYLEAFWDSLINWEHVEEMYSAAK